MSAIQTEFELPPLKRFSAKASQYDFSTLRPGTKDCIVEKDVVDAGKAHGRLTSAVVAWRKRTKSAQKFTVRTFKIDGKDAVGVWALAAEPVAAPAPAASTEPVGEAVAA